MIGFKSAYLALVLVQLAMSCFSDKKLVGILLVKQRSTAVAGGNDERSPLIAGARQGQQVQYPITLPALSARDFRGTDCEGRRFVV
jgi:hypothetical protein